MDVGFNFLSFARLIMTHASVFYLPKCCYCFFLLFSLYSIYFIIFVDFSVYSHYILLGFWKRIKLYTFNRPSLSSYGIII